MMRINTHCLLYALVCSLILLTGCTSPKVRAPAAPAANTSYLNLQPGWRLRVVTPLLRSGGYQLTPQVQQTGTNTMTLSAGKDFMGYETSYYLVRKRRRAGLDIQFLSAEATRNGIAQAERSPTVKLFQLPGRRRYIRLIYLRRVSQSDHDMAVLAADDLDVLADATKQVQMDGSGCHNATELFCSWIPAGIAVSAERPQSMNGMEEWISAR